MARQERSKATGARFAGAKGGKPPVGPSGGPGRRFTGKSGGGLKAGIFGRMREGQDVVAFAAPGARVAVRLYVEAVENFQRQKRLPRHFVLILTQGHESDHFEAYEVAYPRFEPMLAKAERVDAERAYWKFAFKSRCLTTADGTQVELKKVEKRAR